MQKTNFINGSWIDSQPGETRRIMNPATDGLLSEVDYGGGREALAAVSSASNAFWSWSQKTVYERAAFLRTLVDSIRLKKDDLALT